MRHLVFPLLMPRLDLREFCLEQTVEYAILLLARKGRNEAQGAQGGYGNFRGDKLGDGWLHNIYLVYFLSLIGSVIILLLRMHINVIGAPLQA
jgi:hypothetical protein